MAISFGSIGEKYVTFLAADSAKKGEVCKVSTNCTAAGCAAGDEFCGLVREVEGGRAGVQLGGYMEVAFSGTMPSVGYATLAADGNGGVKSAQSGKKCLIVFADNSAKTIGLFL